jgi:hypothetical protein
MATQLHGSFFQLSNLLRRQFIFELVVSPADCCPWFQSLWTKLFSRFGLAHVEKTTPADCTSKTISGCGQ